MRKKDMNRRSALLECARRIEYTDGAEALNIRRLANEARIAVGTVYNYFESKQDVLLAMTEEYWQHALAELWGTIQQDRFSSQIRQIYAFLRVKMDEGAKTLMRSLHKDSEHGLARMAQMQLSAERMLTERLKSDPEIRADVWNERFTMEAFASFVYSNLILLLRQEGDIELFLEIIERILY